VEVDEHRGGAGDDPLRRRVEDVGQPVWGREAGADAVRGVDAHRQPCLAPRHRDVGELDQVAVRLA
jgi:hypothetical protein